MKLSIAFATVFLAATTALPAFAAAAAPRHAVQSQYQQDYRSGINRSDMNAYAASPGAAQRHQTTSAWGHCVGGLESGASSAFPSWDVCVGG
jgi:hypothetical protein